MMLECIQMKPAANMKHDSSLGISAEEQQMLLISAKLGPALQVLANNLGRWRDLRTVVTRSHLLQSVQSATGVLLTPTANRRCVDSAVVLMRGGLSHCVGCGWTIGLDAVARYLAEQPSSEM